MKRAFRGGARSETLKPDPVTELPLTPPAEEDDEEAAISSLAEFSLHSADLALSPTAPPPRASQSGSVYNDEDGGVRAPARRKPATCARPRAGRGWWGRGRGEAGAGSRAPAEDFRVLRAYLALRRGSCRPGVPRFFWLVFMIQGFTFPHDIEGPLLSALSRLPRSRVTRVSPPSFRQSRRPGALRERQVKFAVPYSRAEV